MRYYLGVQKMKIINFDNFSPFKKIREKMDISDDYKPNFKSDPAIMEAIRWEEIKTRGLDISIDELKVAPDGTLEHEDFPGQKMIVYIRDYNGGYKSGSLPKFHISWCATLKAMTESGKYSRYVVSQRDDGFFMLNKMNWGELVEENIKAKLDVCKNCLSKLDHRNYKRSSGKKRDNIVGEFQVKEFLKEYNTDIKVKPKYDERDQPLNQYSPNWDEISYRERNLKKWKCQDCGRDMIANKSSLHVHHIDSNKFNNVSSNLEVVCVECHSKKPMHNHMRSNSEFR